MDDTDGRIVGGYATDLMQEHLYKVLVIGDFGVGKNFKDYVATSLHDVALRLTLDAYSSRSVYKLQLFFYL